MWNLTPDSLTALTLLCRSLANGCSSPAGSLAPVSSAVGPTSLQSFISLQQVFLATFRAAAPVEKTGLDCPRLVKIDAWIRYGFNHLSIYFHLNFPLLSKASLKHFKCHSYRACFLKVFSQFVCYSLHVLWSIVLFDELNWEANKMNF